MSVSSPLSTRHWLLRALGLLLLVAAVAGYEEASAILDPQDTVEVGIFSRQSPGGSFPDGWKPLTFKKIDRYTVYRLVEDAGTTVVEAVSEGGASGMTREVSVDLGTYPYLTWQWKVKSVLSKGDVRTKEGDDYPARIYITFEYDGSRLGLLEKAKYEAIRLFYGRYPPLGALNYLWASNAEIDTLVPNPYTDQVMMFVVQSGEDNVGTWVTETRNVYEDYKTAFGQEPPPVSGVAIMTDTDNTHEATTAYYGDIVFSKEGVYLE